MKRGALLRRHHRQMSRLMQQIAGVQQRRTINHDRSVIDADAGQHGARWNGALDDDEADLAEKVEDGLSNGRVHRGEFIGPRSLVNVAFFRSNFSPEVPIYLG